MSNIINCEDCEASAVRGSPDWGQVHGKWYCPVHRPDHIFDEE